MGPAEHGSLSRGTPRPKEPARLQILRKACRGCFEKSAYFMQGQESPLQIRLFPQQARRSWC